ncbi:MAG: methionine--tRNA ligase [Thermoprotei archaeon]|nr:MAG: methionine--tRNA ligase [Thermoprotei archaeon]
MGDKWLVCSAWPYAHGIPHLGNIIGSILSADVAARYLRLKGCEVVFVSGSDEHGTPIEVEAIKRGIRPKELTDEIHSRMKKLFDRWNISFDNYSRTENPVHIKFVQEFYMDLYERGYIFEDEMLLPFCPKCNRFLPDRFVHGTCPYCGFEDARGDQCDKCGRLLTPTMLINPRCSICGSKPIIKKTKHWFFDLPKLSNDIEKYILENSNLPENARNMSLQVIRDGLKPRSITRDNKWGIPAPFPGAEGKTIYVWMEAVLGYISATIEYFSKKGEKDRWKEFWLNPETKSVYFIGKDNIPFHTIIFPALLIASSRNYNLPWTVASTEYLLYEGQKFSKSRRIGIWIDEALELLPTDIWRFTLVALRPEVRDTSFRWSELLNVINKMLNDDIGNFIYRTLSFIYTRMDGVVPERHEMDEIDKRTVDEIASMYRRITEYMDEFRIRLALHEVAGLARLGNRYLNEREPWNTIKTDWERTCTTMNIAFSIARSVAIMLLPFIPSSAEELLRQMNYNVNDISWSMAKDLVPGGHRINKPKVVFKKLTEKDVEKLLKKLDEIRGSSRS